MVKGRTGKRIRLYVRRNILGFKSYSLACAWTFSWTGRHWLKEDDAAAARSSPAPHGTTRSSASTSGSPPRCTTARYPPHGRKPTKEEEGRAILFFNFNIYFTD
ncbi:hypothetical protein ZWY2020_025153 [Hordeum vulgare]|nr:hypothetical protein ZWY2020_025153 [Hordeum vulgare]